VRVRTRRSASAAPPGSRMIVGPVAGLGSGRCAQDPRGMFLGDPADPLAIVLCCRRAASRPPLAASVVPRSSYVCRLRVFAPRGRTHRWRGLRGSPLTELSAQRSSPAAPASAADAGSRSRGLVGAANANCVPARGLERASDGHLGRPRGSGRADSAVLPPREGAVPRARDHAGAKTRLGAVSVWVSTSKTHAATRKQRRDRDAFDVGVGVSIVTAREAREPRRGSPGLCRVAGG
jgi:hypothetical protein